MRLNVLRAAARCGIAFLLTSVLAACGGGGGGPAPVMRFNDVAPAAGSVNWEVLSGADAQDGALQALAYLPGKITIDEGDSITWDSAGEPHTITFLGAYSSPPGDPTVPTGGNSFDGSNFVSSGFMLPGQKFTLTFTKAGTYAYFCALHAPEMSGVVVVQPRGTSYPQSQALYTAAGTAQKAMLLAQAQLAVAHLPFDGDTAIAAGASGPTQSNGEPSNATVLAFLNNDRLNSTSVTVPVGTTITWRNLSNNEPHTVTFPAAGQQLPPQYQNPFAPPAGGTTYDGTQVVNSGVLNPGDEFQLTFTKPGTYMYECIFHDEEHMVGTVIVK